MSIMTVGSDGHDERQVLLRGRISNVCLVGVLATVLADGVANDVFGVWGPPLFQAFAVVSVWMAVFVVWTAASGAYFGSGEPASRRRFGYSLAVVGAVAGALQCWRLWGSADFMERAPAMPMCAFLVVVGIATLVADLRDAHGGRMDGGDGGGVGRGDL